MSQTSYGTNMSSGYAGLKVDAGYSLAESGVAQKVINFGRAVGAEAADVSSVHMPVRDKGTLTFDADFSEDNVITITINGVACAPVTFTSTHANTATLLLAAIVANAGVTAASKSGNGRVYTVETEGSVLDISVAIAGGTYTGTIPPVEDYVTLQDDVFRGVSIHQHNEAGAYSINDVVSILRQGKIWVDTSVAVNADETAYVDMAGGLGKFTNVSSNNLATGGKFRSTVGAAGLAQLEINLP